MRHWISSVSTGGSVVTLEDGSVWGVNAVDRVFTSIWLPVSNVIVRQAETGIGDYRYILLNTDDGEEALARFLGVP